MAEKEISRTTEFEKDQINEINLGMAAGIDIAVYADSRYLAIQMRQIRLGLIKQLPVELYADPEYDWFQMEEIRKGLEEGLEISKYADKAISYEKMRQIRLGLKDGIDLSGYRDMKADILKQLRIAYKENINLSKYIMERYDAKQLFEIREAIKEGLNIDPYLSWEYIGPALSEIRKGLQAGVDVSVYAKMDYTWRQMRELRLGMENRVEIYKYRSPLYSWRQMREIRTGMELGLDVDSYARLCFTSKEMRKKRLEILESISGEKQKLTKSMMRSWDIEVEISSNSMEAYIQVFKKEQNVTRKRVLEVLKEHNVCAGILESAVEEIISGKIGKKRIMIAKGQVPKKGADGWYECYFRTSLDRSPKIMEDGSADYKNVEWFEIVKAGQKLAYYHRAEPGVAGYTVCGKVILAQRGIEKSILIGKGFELQEDKKTYISTMDGMVRMSDTTLEVTRHLEVDAVTLTTGNIVFDGSLHVKGDVENGMEIRVTEDLEIDGNVSSATIISGGNVLLKKGMNSAGQGYIKAEKSVVSRFFESVRVEAGEDIQVSKCLNSQLYAGGLITSSSVIVGGIACAKKGFQLSNVGNSVGLHTVLKIGYIEAEKKEMNKLQAALLEARNNLKLLNHSHHKFLVKYTAEVRNGLDMFVKLEKAISAERTRIDEIKERLEEYQNKIRDAQVVIRGQANEGTIIDFDGRRWEAENQKNIVVRSSLDQIVVS